MSTPAVFTDNRKAIAAGLSTLAATVLACAPEGVTGNEWIVIAATTLGAFATVWATPANTQAATDQKPVAVDQKDASGEVVNTVVVPGPGATIRTGPSND